MFFFIFLIHESETFGFGPVIIDGSKRWTVTRVIAGGDASIGVTDAARLLLGVTDVGINDIISGLEFCPLSS